MTSEKKLYDLTLVTTETCSLPGLPRSAQLSQTLSGNLCSDLFVSGFSYKRLDLGSGLIAPDDDSYRLLKRIKGAKYIRDDLRQLSAAELLQQLRTGTVRLQEGYIGHTDRVRLALGPAPLTGGDQLFGIELRAGSAFRCFVLTDTPLFPKTVTVGGCPFTVAKSQVIHREPAGPGVLQSDLPVAADHRISPRITSVRG